MTVLGALVSAGGSVVGVLVNPVGRQFGYVFHRQKYIEDLQEQVQNLEAQRKDVDDFIDVAKRNREEILQIVENWIERVDRFIVEGKEFLEGGTNVNQKCLNGWFPDLVTRRRLGKEAKNKADKAKELGKKGKFNDISKPTRPLGIESIPSEQFACYASTNLTMTNVMEALIDDKINFIGIHGIGGVGKTTLVKEIGKKAESNKLFDKVVMAVVSQNPDIKNIQCQIASMLGLTTLTDQQSEIERASTLYARLKQVTKILVILDDVWAKLNFAAVGIPFDNDHQGCKIIITTRRKQVCNSMGMERLRIKIVHLGVLSEKDSWDLFKKNVGDVVDSNVLNVVASEVCKECGGLPIALVTVGSAMKGKDDPTLWDEAARELRKSVPTNIEGVDQHVYKSLKLSYDYLQDEESKACFLLCSLFPEDCNILIEDLVRYGMGLRVFKNVDTVHEARGRAKSITNNLIACCLLLASKQDCIKMHDVVRDVAIDIGSKKYFVRVGRNLKDWPNMDSLDQYTGISLMRNQISNLPEVLECPKLQILLLQDNKNAWSCSDEFFSRMNVLSVLDLSQYLYRCDNPIRCPDAFNNQTCLRTLVLGGIKFGDTKFLGQLKTLEVLSLRHAFFSEAPNAIRELTNLRLLDMTESCHEFLIPAAMLLLLSHLEELYLFGTKYSSRSGDPAVEVAAALRSWPRLKVLTISIPDIAYIPKDFVFPELESFSIFIGKSGVSVEDYSRNYLNLANLVGTTINWSKWPKIVLKRVTRLRIEDCSELEYLINTEEREISSQEQPCDLHVPFNLEELELISLDSFKGAASALNTFSWVCFPKLRSLRVGNCPSLSTGFLPFNLLQRLQHLETLTVFECEKLEQVFDFGSEGEGMKLLSSLRNLTLFDLPRLKHILNCSSLQHVQFCNLRSMTVISSGKLKYVFQPSIAQALHQLEFLCVNGCEEMEEIVAAKQNEGHEEEERVDYKMVFKSLKQLCLENLPNLSGFCTGGDTFPFEWPSLEILGVINCPKMNTFAATTSGSTPKLKEVQVGFDHCKKIPLQGMDLNQFVQTHIISKPPKIIMGRKRKLDHPRRMMSDVVHKRTSAAPPSEEASHRPPSEGPLVPPLSDQPPQRPLLVARPSEEASQRAPLVAPQQLSSTQPPRLPLVRPPSVAPPLEEASQRAPSEGPLVPPHRPPSVPPQQLPSQLESSTYEPSADPSTSSQTPSGHVSSSSTLSRCGRGCAKGIREWGTGTKLDIQFDENYCPIGDNVSKLTTQLGIIVRNGNIVPLTFLDWNTVPDDILDDIWKDVKDNLNICPEEYKPICMKNCNSIWKDHKNKIKSNYFKPRSEDPNLKDDVPLHIVPSQWEELMEYWRTSDAEKIATRNAKNRRAHGIAHTTGCTTFAQIRHEMTNKGESTDKMNVWLMTRRADDPEVIQTLDEFNGQLSMLPEDCRTLEARNAIFHELIGHDNHGYCRTYGRTVPRRAVYKDGVGPSQSALQPSTIVQIIQQVCAELRDELREELRAEFSTHLQQLTAEMMAFVSQGASVDPNRQAPDASSGHRAFRESAEDENPYTPPPEDQIFPE